MRMPRLATTLALAATLAVLGSMTLAQQGSHADGHDHRHIAHLAGSDILPPLGVEGADVQLVEVWVDEHGFAPSTVEVVAGRPLILVFLNPTDREHHYHISDLEPEALSWFMVVENELDAYRLEVLFGVERALDHICDASTGICRLGINVHMHSNPGRFDAIMFTAPLAGSFSVEDPLNPSMRATFVVN
jgi:hypothetical protein